MTFVYVSAGILKMHKYQNWQV